MLFSSLSPFRSSQLDELEGCAIKMDKRAGGAKSDFADNGSRCQGYFGDNLVPRNRQFAVGRSYDKTGPLQNLKIVMDVLIVALHSPGQSPYANRSDLVNKLEHLQPPGRENPQHCRQVLEVETFDRLFDRPALFSSPPCFDEFLGRFTDSLDAD